MNRLLWLRRLFRRRTALVGFAIIAVFAIAGAFAPYLSPHDPTDTALRNRLSPPSLTHLLGTDELGRDMLSRILHGARVTLLMGIISIAIALTIGTFIGALSGYYGGITDLLGQRIIDVLMAIPPMLLAIVVVAILGPGLWNAMIAVGVSFIPSYGRTVRASILELREQVFVEASRAIGVGSLTILRRHILPNCLGPMLVLSTLLMGTAILLAAGLGFLGLGVQPPTPEWGAMLGRTRVYMRLVPHVAIFPGLAIALAVLGFNLMGDGLRDALDPRMRRQL